jgi:hypothetical protein
MVTLTADLKKAIKKARGGSFEWEPWEAIASQFSSAGTRITLMVNKLEKGRQSYDLTMKKFFPEEGRRTVGQQPRHA